MCSKTRILWVFPIAFKQFPIRIIRFILKTLKNEHNPSKLVIVDDDGALKKSKDIINVLVNYFIIPMDNTGGDAS